MIKYAFSFVFLTYVLSSCITNSIEDATPDCGVSTLDFTYTINDADCAKRNGSISITATGGHPPYAYALDNETAQPESEFLDLPSGEYSVIVFDDVRCNVLKKVVVGSVGGIQVSATSTPSGCQSSNGSISIMANGGEEPYSYKLNGGGLQANSMFSGLDAGEHEVIITDVNGCDFSILKTILSGTSYASSIKPIISNSCAISGCHDGSTSQTNFSIFSNVQSSASSIRSRTQSGSMPKNSSLTQAQIDAIACWVDDGAFEN